MIEAEIRCISPTLRVTDLNLNLIRGQVVYIPEDTARASGDLALLSRAGGLHLKYVERVRERRDGPVTSPQQAPAPRRFLRPVVVPEVSRQIVREVQVPAAVDEDRIVRRVTEQVVNRMDTMQGTLTDAITAALKNVAVQGAAAPATGAGSSPAPEVADDHPMFIPEVIDRKESTASISVESETGGAGVDDAAAALKAMKQKRKAPARKTKTKTKTTKES